MDEVDRSGPTALRGSFTQTPDKERGDDNGDMSHGPGAYLPGWLARPVAAGGAKQGEDVHQGVMRCMGDG